jgi:trimethylamine--corrinoid protein Co-methyltransferase
MEVMLNNTTKPIVFATYEMSECIDSVKMAEVAAGGPKALAEKPFIACYINPTTGLRHNKEALQKLFFIVGNGIPFF